MSLVKNIGRVVWLLLTLLISNVLIKASLKIIPLSHPHLKTGLKAGLDDLVHVRLLHVERSFALQAIVAHIAREGTVPHVLKNVRSQRLLALGYRAL